ncbi:MAG TPA: ABC transporter permease [Limnochordia bacterium]|nr:ABC transporter permease [Limnochordia bacterium]
MPRMKVASDRRLILRRFFRRPAAILGFAIVALFVFCALFAPFLAPYGPDQPDFSKARRGPSPEHWLGNDELGRDLFSRLLYGARISGMIGVIAVAIGLVLGVPMGLISGFYGGWIDALMMRLVDVMLAFPSTLLAIGMVAILGPGLTNAILAVGVVAVPVYVRLVRASTLSVKGLDYISAARALGASDARLMWRHVLPQCLGPILVQSSLQMAAAILAAAGLGFLGLGAPPDVPEWGTMLAKGRTYIFSAPHLTMYPGLAILLVVMGFNLLGDALRDALDPRIG